MEAVSRARAPGPDTAGADATSAGGPVTDNAADTADE
jgi:hypothetical protein